MSIYLSKHNYSTERNLYNILCKIDRTYARQVICTPFTFYTSSSSSY